jgi:cell wall-associated NlpC family hydrolase
VIVNGIAMEQEERARVVAETRSWIGTPYHNCADVKGVGVDCGMLIVRCFVDTGLCGAFDPRPYAPDWHLHRGEEKYLGFVFDRCAELAEHEEAQAGDVIVFKYGRCYSHGGIITGASLGRGKLVFVHAFWPAKKVIEDRLDRNLQLSHKDRAHRIFSYWKSRAV